MTESWEPELPHRDPPAPPRGFPKGLTVATAIGLAILIGLGVWQLERLTWKRHLLAEVAALQSAPARPAADVLGALAKGGDVDFTRVTLVCPGLATAPFVELYGLRDGQIGWRLISACPLQGGAYGALLVDRGFVADTVAGRPPVDRTDQTPQALTGILRRPDPRSFVTPADSPQTNRWYARDPASMAKALGVGRPAPVFLFAETATTPSWPALTPSPLPTEIPNRHLEYAWTWFGLAAALAGVYAAMLCRRKA